MLIFTWLFLTLPNVWVLPLNTGNVSLAFMITLVALWLEQNATWFPMITQLLTSMLDVIWHMLQADMVPSISLWIAYLVEELTLCASTSVSFWSFTLPLPLLTKIRSSFILSWWHFWSTIFHSAFFTTYLLQSLSCVHYWCVCQPVRAAYTEGCQSRCQSIFMLPLDTFSWSL